jgi:hypothetical protein
MFSEYVRQVATGAYPAPEHQYSMPADEVTRFLRSPDDEDDELEPRNPRIDPRVSGPW